MRCSLFICMISVVIIESRTSRLLLWLLLSLLLLWWSWILLRLWCCCWFCGGTFLIRTRSFSDFMYFLVKSTLPLLDDLLLNFCLSFLLKDLFFKLLKPLHLVIPLSELLESVFVLFLQEIFKFIKAHLCIFDLVNVGLWHVDQLRTEGIAQNFVVHIVWPKSIHEQNNLITFWQWRKEYAKTYSTWSKSNDNQRF